MADTIVTDDYGVVPRGLWKNLKKWNVSPADWDQIIDAFEGIDQPVDFSAAERYIRDNLKGGKYQEPWPMNPREVREA